jgi:hypothetical protein
MRIYRLAVIAALFSLWFASLADAALEEQVQFWVYDVPGSPVDGKVTLDLSNFGLSGPEKLQYSIDNNSGWSDVGSTLPTITLSGGQHQIYLRLSTNADTAVTSGDLKFMGQNGNYYNGAAITWTGNSGITFAVAGAAKLSPTEIPGTTVPVPPAAFLFGSGLSGLFFVRRKKSRSVIVRNP